MSLDASLKSGNSLIRHRNVLTRGERLLQLKEEEKWDEKKSVYGLPKVGHRKQEIAKTVKEDADAAAVPGAAPAAGGAAAGAKGSTPGAKGGAAPATKGAAPAAKGAAPAAKGAAPAAKGAAPAGGAKKK
jgi:small basic protein (TIGR04137 family)